MSATIASARSAARDVARFSICVDGATAGSGIALNRAARRLLLHRDGQPGGTFGEAWKAVKITGIESVTGGPIGAAWRIRVPKSLRL